MKAILRRGFGGPEVLYVGEHADPVPVAGEVTVEVRAFGLNHAELHMRRGEWPQAAPISGIECAGVVHAAPGGEFRPGQAVVALMGGLGRTRNGSYAQLTQVPASNVVAVDATLEWAELAALPESYATAWACLHGNLALRRGQTLLVRGATSALGQAAVNLARDAGATVIASTRQRARVELLQALGAGAVVMEDGGLESAVRDAHPRGVDAVLELTGNSTLLASMALVRPGGRLCLAGFLGGLAPIDGFNPVAHMPSRVHLSFFGSFAFGTPGFALGDVPLRDIVAGVQAGRLRARPAQVYGFEDIAEAHRVMEANTAGGKLVVQAVPG